MNNRLLLAILAIVIVLLAGYLGLPSLSSSKRKWSPSHSKYLTYNATRSKLSKVDGVYVVNLKRRPDRLETFKKLSGLEDEDFHLFEAIDGKSLSWNPELERIFKNNRYGSANGVVGCAMSHYSLWKHIATTKNQLHLILEDDAIFKQGWLKKWNREYAPDLPRNAMLVFIGGILQYHEALYPSSVRHINSHFDQHIPTLNFPREFDAEMDTIPPTVPRRRFCYTTVSYLVSSAAAKVLVDIVDTYGVIRAIDHTLHKLLDLPNVKDGCYTSNPVLVDMMPLGQKHRWHADDSDVQIDRSPIPGAPIPDNPA